MAAIWWAVLLNLPQKALDGFDLRALELRKLGQFYDPLSANDSARLSRPVCAGSESLRKSGLARVRRALLFLMPWVPSKTSMQSALQPGRMTRATALIIHFTAIADKYGAGAPLAPK